MSADKLICWGNHHDDDLGGGAGPNDDASTSSGEQSKVIEYTRTRSSDFICAALGYDNRDQPHFGTTSFDNGDKSSSTALVAAATVDNLITVWDFESAQVLLSLPGHSE